MKVKDPLISLEVANLAKKAGFDWPCKRYYTGDINKDGSDKIGYAGKKYIYNKGLVLSAPTQTALHRWFMEVHNINIGTVYFSIPQGNYWEYRIHYKQVFSVIHTDYVLGWNDILKKACLLILLS